MTLVRRSFVAIVGIVLVTIPLTAVGRPSAESVVMRGQTEHLLVYGPASGQPIIVSSGDGGWIHLAPHVAEYLSDRGFYVIGFDVRAYLESFTGASATLHAVDEPTDYKVLADFARKNSGEPPILLGVSEGAGLSALAATDPAMKSEIAGVIGLGMPDRTELGWRWKDAVIYVTHGVPHEPIFRTSVIAPEISPVPLALIHSTHDEYVPVADVTRILTSAREPKQLWLVEASNHRFSGNTTEFQQRLIDAIDWINAHRPR